MRYNRTMKNTNQLTKKEAYALFGGAEAVSVALGYTTAATAHNWPPVLSLGVSDRVRGAAWRLGLIADPVPQRAPAPRTQAPRRRWPLRGGGRAA